jgi:hypothetical protein
VVKRNYDDIIITVGAVVLGLGLYSFIQGYTSRAYATYAYVAAPACAAACDPFKNSPGTWATCCKQHAATAAQAAKPKPTTQPALSAVQKANPAPVVKAVTPKPKTVGQLHQGQMTFYDKIGDPGLLTNPGLPPARPYTGPIMNARPNVTNTTNNFNMTAPPITMGAGGEQIPQGKLPYTPKRTLGTFQIDRSKGINGRNYHSGGSSDTTEANVTDIGNVTNQMAVVYFNFPANCRGTHGDEADIKLWGPAHHDGNCCWCLVSINGNGDVCTGGEGNHPHTDKCRQKVNNVGNIKGKDIGLAHVIQQTSAGAHSEVWVDLGNGFKLMGHADGKCYGPDNGSSTPSANQQPQFRCDCMPNGQYVQIHSAVVYEI